MGWERKRGKLHELNRLLRGATDTSFVRLGGRSPAVPLASATCITLDADTRLPRGVAKRLVGKMAHPLNAPRFDAQCGRVVEGYGVLQPRVTPSLPTGARDRSSSACSRVRAASTLMRSRSPTCTRICFGEGSYSGKGIYDVDVFEAALEGVFPTTRF